MQKRYQLLGWFLLAAAILLLFGSPGRAAVLDQAQTQSDTGFAFFADLYPAQTFTPALSGQLAAVKLKVGLWSDQPNQVGPEIVHVQIASWDGTAPGTVLGQVDKIFTASNSTSMVWQAFDFLSKNINLTADETYAIILYSNLESGISYNPLRQTGFGCQLLGSYPNGAMYYYNDFSGSWYSSNSDLAFETWMQTPVPLPGAGWLFASGLLELAAICRRR